MTYGNAMNVRVVEGMTQEDACQHFRKKVLLLARRLASRLAPGNLLTTEDLVSIGVMGLLDAFQRYDPSLGIQFTTYAEYRIRGSMLDAIREMDTFSRRRRMLARRIETTAQGLTADLGRAPSHEELASKLGMDMDAYWDAVERVTPDVPVPLDSPPDQGGPDESALFAAIASDGDAAIRHIMRDDLRRLIRQAIAQMPERTRHCIILYYARDFSLAEIASLFEITVSRVSQILTEARARIRRELEPHVSHDDVAWMEEP